MKLKAILPAVLFAAISSMSVGVFAADAAPAADKAPAADAAKPQAKKVKPHSHMEEKMGTAPKASDAAPAAEEKADKPKAKAKASKDKHSHPRDGK